MGQKIRMILQLAVLSVVVATTAVAEPQKPVVHGRSNLNPANSAIPRFNNQNRMVAQNRAGTPSARPAYPTTTGARPPGTTARPPAPSGTKGPGSSGAVMPSAKGGPAFAEANPEDITDENYPELIESFDYPNADIQDMVKAISKLTGKNFIIDNDLKGKKITIIAPSQITVAEAYRAFLSALAINGMTIVPSGKFLKIRNARKAQTDNIETYGGNYFPNADQMITRIIKLKYISADEISKNIRNLNSPDGTMYPYPPTNSIIMSDWGSNIERVSNILAQLDTPGFEEQLAVIRIRHAKSKDIADLLDQIVNKESKKSSANRFNSGVPRFRPNTPGGGSGTESFSLVISDDRTNSIIVVGNSSGIRKIRELVAKLDFKLRPEEAGGVFVYYVRHGESEKIANVLNGVAQESKKAQTAPAASGPTFGGPPPQIESNAVFGGDVKVQADKDTNSLIITASKQDYEVVRTILAKIDIARDQVYVKGLIMEMNADNNTNWGVDYYNFIPGTNGIGRAGFRTGDSGKLIDPTKDGGFVFGFAPGSMTTIKINGADVQVPSQIAFFNLIRTNVMGNILSEPQLMALDNEKSVIEVGQTVPVGQTQSTTGTTASVSTQREKLSIKLEITPYISPDTPMVRMKLLQTVKGLAKGATVGNELDKTAVVTNEKEINTTIYVNSGDTAVLGGLMQDQESEEIKKVPILGDIPILGWLFKAKSSEKRKTNLMVFLTPKIIRSQADSADVLNQKINERLDFIQRNMNGRDPYGETIDNLPRRSSVDEPRMRKTNDPITPSTSATPPAASPSGSDPVPQEQEEPAAETF